MNIIEISTPCFVWVYRKTLLPTVLFGIPCALEAVSILKSYYQNPDSFKQNCTSFKDRICNFFKRKEDESPTQQKKRFLRYAAITTVAVSSVVIMIRTGSQLPASQFWSLSNLLPCQTPAVVTAEYLAVGAAHGIKAHRAWTKGDKAQATMHLTAGVSSALFPMGYALQEAPMRLHHSFTGLGLMLAPSKPIQVLGTALAADSALYFVDPSHGQGPTYLGPSMGFYTQRITVQYDFMNTLLDNLPVVITATVAQCAAEKGIETLKKIKSDDKADKSD